MPAVTSDPTTQQGKFVVIQGSPPALPGCCFLCSTTKQTLRFIDPRRDLEWHGTVYLCEECVIEMAQNLGMLEEERSNDLLDDNRILTERLAVAYKQIEDLEQTIDLVTQRRLSDRVTGSNPSVDTGQDSVPVNAKDASDDVNGTEDTELELTESVIEQGPDDLSDDGSDEFSSPAGFKV